MSVPYDQRSVAVVGCGQWGRNHARVFHELGARLTLCDSDSRTLAELERRLSPSRTTSDYDAVLADAAIGAVVLATPAETHFAMARRALLAGKDLLVEKPMALRSEEGRELVRLAAEQGRVLMVGHLLRYHPAIVKLQELIRAGTLGDIQYIYSNRLNLGRVRQEENALWSFAPHDISVIIHLLGSMPTQVSATGGAFIQPAIADVSVSSLLFESGAQGHVFVSWLHPFKEQRLVVVGSKRMAVFEDSLAADKLDLYDKDIQRVGAAFVARTPSRQPVPIEPTEPLLAEARHFLDCIASRAAPWTDGEEGLRVLAILEACQASLERNGEPVRLRALLPTAPSGASEPPPFVHPSAYVDEQASIGSGTKVWHFCHVMPQAQIGKGCVLGQNTFVGRGVRIGNGVKVQNNVSLYEGITLEDLVFCGPSVVFTNVINPRSAIPRRDEFQTTLVRQGATLGANATILCGITIGQNAFVGAGAVVTKSVPDYALVVGVPARQVGWMCRCGTKLATSGDGWACAACGDRYVLRGENLEPALGKVAARVREGA